MSSNEAELFKAHRQTQERNDYFLLAAAGAAIGFALTQTKGAHLQWAHAPLAAATLCWGLSFYVGCRRLTLVEDVLWTNFELLRIQRGEDPRVGNHPQVVAAASEGVRSAIAKKDAKAVRRGRWQFRLLILGALAYIAWHVLQMYLRTPPQ